MNKGVIVGVLIAVLVLAGIGGGIWLTTRPKTASGPSLDTPSAVAVPTSTTVGDQTEEEVQVVPDEEEPTGPVKEFTVTGSSNKFSPASLTVKKGDTVRITFKSSGNALHDFMIDEFDVATSQLGDEEEEEVEFVANKTGTFDYYCSVSNHRAMGMVGKLVVQ